VPGTGLELEPFCGRERSGSPQAKSRAQPRDLYLPTAAVELWCREQDSNLHALRHWILSPARLPIPPSRLETYSNEGAPSLSLRSFERQGGDFPATLFAMTVPNQPNIKLTNAPDYRENYANSVQVRVNVWDFFLVFGTMQQQTEAQVEVKNIQGIYLSPQQAKALMAILQQNVAGYESAFGEIKLDPRMAAAGPIH
jgi:hypothetical protein